MPLFNQNQVAAKEVQTLIREDWFHPQTLRQYLEALKIWQSDQLATTIDGQPVFLNRILYDLKQFLHSLPLSTRQNLAKYGLTESSFDKFPLPLETLTILDQTLIEIAGLTPQTPESNIPANLRELVAEAETAAAASQTVKQPFDLKSQIDRAQKINAYTQQLKVNTTGRLFHLLQDSSYVKDLQSIYGRDAVNKILWDRLDATAQQAITVLTVNQAGLLNQDPSRAAAYFTKQLAEIIKNDDLLPTALAKTPKPAQKTVLKDIQKQTLEAVQELKPVAAEFQAEQVKAPINPESAQKIASQNINLPDKQRQRLFRELQKHPQDQPEIMARIFLSATPAELHEKLSLLAPLISVPRHPTLAELCDKNSLITLVRANPHLFPHSVIRQIVSGRLSTPQESALIQIVANRLGISLDVATLYRAGLNPVSLIINHFSHLASGKKILGLFPTQPKADKTHPVIAEIDRRLEEFSKIDSALQDIPPALPQGPFRKFKSLSRGASRQTQWEQRLDSFRLDQSLRYGIHNIRSFQSTGRTINSFFSALRVRSAPVNYIFNAFESVGGGFRSFPSIISSPFRAAGNFINHRIFTPAKAWIGNQARAGLTKIGAWVAKTGAGKAAKALAIKLGGSLLAKGTAALLANAVPVIGQIGSALTILSLVGDVARGIWNNREIIAKIGLGLASAGLIFVSHLLGLLGTAAWGLGGGILGGIIGSAFGLPGTIIGAGIGGAIGAWVGGGGLSSALTAAGAWLGSAAAGIGNFLASLSVPISGSIITAITSWSVLGGLGIVGGVAIINNVQQNSALVVPEASLSGNITIPPGCPAPIWPLDLTKGQKYAVTQGPGGWCSHGPPLSPQPASCGDNTGFSYAEAIDIGTTPPNTISETNLVIATHPGVVEKVVRDDNIGNYVRIQDSCGGNFTSVYVHMEVIPENIKEGSTIKGGEILGVVGDSGAPAQVHLHYEFRESDGITHKQQGKSSPPFMTTPYIPAIVPLGCVGRTECNTNIP